MLFIDLDHVLTVHDERKFLDFCEQNGCHVNTEQFDKTQSFTESIIRPGREGAQFLDDLLCRFMQTKQYSPRAIPGALEAVKTLSTRYKICILTARGKMTKRLTKKTVTQCFPRQKFIDIHMHHHGRKGVMLNRFRNSILIDDSHYEVNLAAKTAPTSLIIHFPSIRKDSNIPLPPQVSRGRVTRLKACDHLPNISTLSEKDSAWRDAWNETVKILMAQSVPTST